MTVYTNMFERLKVNRGEDQYEVKSVKFMMNFRVALVVANALVMGFPARIDITVDGKRAVSPFGKTFSEEVQELIGKIEDAKELDVTLEYEYSTNFTAMLRSETLDLYPRLDNFLIEASPSVFDYVDYTICWREDSEMEEPDYLFVYRKRDGEIQRGRIYKEPVEKLPRGKDWYPPFDHIVFDEVDLADIEESDIPRVLEICQEIKQELDGDDITIEDDRLTFYSSLGMTLTHEKLLKYIELASELVAIIRKGSDEYIDGFLVEGRFYDSSDNEIKLLTIKFDSDGSHTYYLAHS